MARASESQKAERLNRARELLQHVDHLSDAVEQLAQDCSISPRQAYRYLEQAHRLKEPVPPSEAKLAFTVKLPRSLVVCWACSAVWGCKSPAQPDGGEGLVRTQGLPPRGGV